MTAQLQAPMTGATTVLMTEAEAREKRAAEALVKFPPGELTKYGKPRMSREEAEACVAKAREALTFRPTYSGATGRRTGPADVYRFYGAEGALLYVGLSCSLAARIGQHRNHQGWWQQVERIEIEHLPSRDAASAREKELIAALQPLHNLNGGGA